MKKAKKKNNHNVWSTLKAKKNPQELCRMQQEPKEVETLSNGPPPRVLLLQHRPLAVTHASQKRFSIMQFSSNNF